MDCNYMLDKIAEASSYVINLNTLINEKWYDKQEQFIKNLEGIKYDLLTLQSCIKQEKTKDEMIKKLRNLCKIFNECSYCPIHNFTTSKCPVCDHSALSKLKFQEVAELYDKLNEWVKELTINEGDY